MVVLGINGNFGTDRHDLVPGMADYYFHDASACVVRDGELVAAAEQERFNRIKKTTKFPGDAARACLAQAGVRAEEIEAVAYYFDESFVEHALNSWYVENPSIPVQSARELVEQRLAESLGAQGLADRLHFVPHHHAHAWSAFARSGFEDALVVVLDARGEEHSSTILRGQPGKLETLGTLDISQSLGNFYEAAISFLGYRFGDEYKVMGLAPYGDPERFAEIFDGFHRLGPDGTFELNPGAPEMNLVAPTFFEHGFSPRRRGEPFTRDHMDFAAALQAMLEKVAMHVIGHWQRQTGLRRLCFTGGVAHNSTLNGILVRSGLFDEVFVHPASHDAGASEGAALAVASELGEHVTGRRRLDSAALGPDLPDRATIRGLLAGWGDCLLVEESEDVIGDAARWLADGAAIGWVQGRSEFGPRALGQRSIIADARPARNQTRINAMVKKRESYRPFAPAVTEEAAAAYFDLSGAHAVHDFMSFVVPVRPEQRDHLGAVTHVDGSARVQVVRPGPNPVFHALLARFGDITGTPVLLNTSFNNDAEPIVEDVDDAVTSFLTTGLDGLVVGDFIVRRGPAGPIGIDDLVPDLRPVTRVSRETVSGPHGPERHHEVRLDYATGPRRTISARAHAVLEAIDGTATVARCARRTVGELDDELRTELHELWQKRLIVLRPTRTRP